MNLTYFNISIGKADVCITLSLLFVLLCCLSGCASTEFELLRTKEAELTSSHGTEARLLIEQYRRAQFTPEFQTNPDVYGRFLSGPRLANHLRYIREFSQNYHQLESLILREVHVLEYTTSKIKAIGCGQVQTNLKDTDGTLLQRNSSIDFMGIYVFVLEEETWKLYANYSFREPERDIRDWRYLSNEEKTAIGRIEGYIARYFPCGLET